MTALTNTAIDALQPGKELKDDRVPGLSVRAHNSGKSFMLYYRTRSGTPRRPKLGDCANMSLADARELAKEWLRQVSAGGDPAKGFKDARAEPDMAELWRRCEKEHYCGGRAWDIEAKRLFKVHVKPKIGKLRVRDVDYAEIDRLHKALRDKPVLANRILAILSKMLHLAERWNLRAINTNPCSLVERFREKERRRYASPAEITQIGAVLDRYAQQPEHMTGVAFLYVMLFSGARPTEIERATPAMIERHVRDGAAYGVLRIEHGKTGQRDVFLPAQAMAILDKLPAKREHLAGRPHMPRRLWRLVRKEVGCHDLWARDMRRTFATVGYSSGVDKKVMGNLLGHASTATTEIYAKLMEDPAHAAAAATANEIGRLLNQAGTGQRADETPAEQRQG